VIRNKIFMFSFMVFAFLCVTPRTVISASLPQSTQKMLKKIKLEPSILADIDQELAIPKDLMEKAKKEGRVRVRGTSGVARN